MYFQTQLEIVPQRDLLLWVEVEGVNCMCSDWAKGVLQWRDEQLLEEVVVDEGVFDMEEVSFFLEHNLGGDLVVLLRDGAVPYMDGGELFENVDHLS